MLYFMTVEIMVGKHNLYIDLTVSKCKINGNLLNKHYNFLQCRPKVLLVFENTNQKLRIDSFNL